MKFSRRQSSKRSIKNLNLRFYLWLGAAVAVLSVLLLYKLGSLAGGVSASEAAVAHSSLGWHGIYRQPFYLPLKLVRSALFVLFSHHGQTIIRLGNTLFGALAVVAFAVLIKLWHNTRTAILATILFATAAWVLHVSRLASYDVLYLCAAPVLLVTQWTLRKASERAAVFYTHTLVLGVMLYLPGMLWLVGLTLFWEREAIADGWRYFHKGLERPLYVLAWLIWLPLLAINLTRGDNWRLWLGLPAHLAPPLTILKQFAAVPVHLLIRGPEYPAIWLGRAPLLDVFTLAMALLGIYVYATHRDSPRSQALLAILIVGWVMVGLGGPSSLSLLVPLLYIAAATGIAYLLHGWLKTFPLNPLARGFGVSLIVLAVVLAAGYNLRAYFVAWPHNGSTRATFRHHIK